LSLEKAGGEISEFPPGSVEGTQFAPDGDRRSADADWFCLSFINNVANIFERLAQLLRISNCLRVEKH
jgi:hypothetical protein